MSCFTGKIGYVTEELANSALVFAQLHNDKKRKKPIRVFFCTHCGRYHLTSQEKRHSEGGNMD